MPNDLNGGELVSREWRFADRPLTSIDQLEQYRLSFPWHQEEVQHGAASRYSQRRTA